MAAKHIDTSATPEPEKEKKGTPLPCWKSFVYGLPGGALLPFTGMWALYGNKYYEEFGAKLAIIALFTAMARSFDLIADPLISYMTDASGTDMLPCRCFKKYGRRRPYMFVGAFFMGGSVWMLLNPPYVGSTMLSLWFGFFYLVYYVWESITAIPYNAFGAELSDDSDERTGAFFFEGLFEGMGAMVMVTAPIAFTMINVPGYSERNEAVCVGKVEAAEHCLKGNACTDFFEQGWSAAYQPEGPLTAALKGATLKMLDGAIEVMDYKKQCSGWGVTADRSRFAAMVINGTAAQNDQFCECFDQCSKACSVAENRTAFMCVGYLFAAYIIPTVWLSCWKLRSVWDPAIHGISGADWSRKGEVIKAPPLVPSLMATMENKPFRILLPTWTMDGLVQAVVMALPYYYVQAVIAPSYMTMENDNRDCAPSSPGYRSPDCGGPGNSTIGFLCTGLASIKDTDDYNVQCDTDMVIAVAGMSFLLAALASVPFWMFICKVFGKHYAWMGFSLSHSIAAVPFLFLGRGQVLYLWAVTALNGIPFGAKFTNDAVLADIVDYDEFLTGNRKEATYFMAKSFIPKVVQIPAAVLPIAFLPAAGYIQPINGFVQEQPDSVTFYIKGVSFIGVCSALFAYILKFKYKLKNTDLLQKSLNDIKEGREGIDPITGVLWKPENIDTREDEERTVFYQCSYFSRPTMRKIMAGDRAVIGKCRCAVIAAVIVTVLFAGGVVGTLGLLEEAELSFLPTLCMIGCGLMIAVNMWTFTRYKAAKRLCAELDNKAQDDKGARRSLSRSQSIAKFIDYTEKREVLGRSSTRAMEEDGAKAGGEEDNGTNGNGTAPDANANPKLAHDPPSWCSTELPPQAPDGAFQKELTPTSWCSNEDMYLPPNETQTPRGVIQAAVKIPGTYSRIMVFH